jgi:uncharacterized protein DUF3800
VVCLSQPTRIWRRIMGVTAYVDDSGSDLGNVVYVLGGPMLPDSIWEIVKREWGAVLARLPSIAYFKASEVWDREKGPFASFSDDERRDKVYALADVIACYKPLAISCELNRLEFENFKSTVHLRPGYDDPYFFLFYALIAQVSLLGRCECSFGPVDFYFDDQNGIGQKAKDWYPTFLERCSQEVVECLSPRCPEFDDEKKVIPLQAADMYAWYRRRSVLGSVVGPFHEIVWSALSHCFRAATIEACNLPYIAEDLGIAL